MVIKYKADSSHETLCDILPEHFNQPSEPGLLEIIVDLGQKPYATYAGNGKRGYIKRHDSYLSKNPVTEEDIARILAGCTPR